MDSRLDSRPAKGANHAPESRRSTVLLWLVWVLWIPFFTPQILDLLQSNPGPLRLALSLVGVIVFFALYLWVSWQSARSLTTHAMRVFPTGLALWAPVAGLFALGAGLTTLNGNSWGTIFFYVSSGAAGWLPTKKAIPVIAGLVLFIAAAFAFQGNLAEAESPVVLIGTVGAIVIAFTWSAANSQQLRLAREEMARAAAVSEERLRIARDLHDVVAHSIAVINVQANTALHLMQRQPDRARSALTTINDVSKQALEELRAVVGVLRDSGELAPRSPAPSLGRLDELIARAAEAGLAVRVDVHGKPTKLPIEADVAAYRIVQEALTNAARHSGGSRAWVRLGYGPDGLDIQVDNDGPAPAAPTHKDGSGVAGMSERAEALGGRLAAEPRREGGFRVTATLPIRPAAHRR
jgi:signal transduction histidine kinase